MIKRKLSIVELSVALKTGFEKETSMNIFT